MSNQTLKIDFIGVSASFLCLIHCMATPLIFIAKANSIYAHEIAPFWWKSMDWIFLTFSFYAVYRTTKIQHKKWLNNILWGSWMALFTLIINEKTEFIHLPELLIYIPSVLLILAHLYNLMNCECTGNKCCINN